MGLVYVDAEHTRFEAGETCAKSTTQSRSRAGYDDILRLPILVHHSQRHFRKVGREGHYEYDRIVAFETLAAR